jgi:hypothetical protein
MRARLQTMGVEEHLIKMETGALVVMFKSYISISFY